MAIRVEDIYVSGATKLFCITNNDYRGCPVMPKKAFYERYYGTDVWKTEITELKLRLSDRMEVIAYMKLFTRED